MEPPLCTFTFSIVDAALGVDHSMVTMALLGKPFPTTLTTVPGGPTVGSRTSDGFFDGFFGGTVGLVTWCALMMTVWLVRARMDESR